MANQSLTDLSARLAISISRFLEQKKSALSHLETRLDGVNIEKILKKDLPLSKIRVEKRFRRSKASRTRGNRNMLQDGEVQFLVQPKK